MRLRTYLEMFLNPLSNKKKNRVFLTDSADLFNRWPGGEKRWREKWGGDKVKVMSLKPLSKVQGIILRHPNPLHPTLTQILYLPPSEYLEVSGT